MDIEISTPALLFPALSLLLLAFTNRFLATGSLIRMLTSQARKEDDCEVKGQINNLKLRLELTKWMQIFGVLSILLCTLSMFGLFLGYYELGKKVFGLSLISMGVSLCISMWEVYISTHALHLELQDLDSKCS